MKVAGYIVMEYCEDYEQGLRVVQGDGFPPGGILDWCSEKRHAVAIFATPAEARAIINRTDHYRLAFGSPNVPEKADCKTVPVKFYEKD